MTYIYGSMEYLSQPVETGNQVLRLNKHPENENITRQYTKVLRGRSREAEDLIGSQYRARQLSLPPKVDSEISKEEMISKKSGALWECIECSRGSLGGHVYVFRLQDECDDVTREETRQQNYEAAKERSCRVFPAIELLGSHMAFLDPTVPAEVRTAKYGVSIEIMDTLHRLGYECAIIDHGVYLKFPDREALLARWKELREECQELPILDIVSSAGIAEHIPFIESFLTHDALLSTGKEFVHDHMFHVIPTLVLALSSVGKEVPYEKAKAKSRKAVAYLYRRLMVVKQIIERDRIKLDVPSKPVTALRKNIEKIELVLGGVVDNLGAYYDYSKLLDVTAKKMENFLLGMEGLNADPLWVKLLAERFPGEDQKNPLKELWKTMIEIERAYDGSRLVRA